MILSHLSFSQNGYPKEVILNKDTLVALKYSQLKEINKALQEGENCKVLLLEEEKLVLKYDSLIKDGTSLVVNLKSQLSEKDLQLGYKDQQIDLRDKEIKKILRTNKTNKTIFGITIGSLVAGLLGFIIYTAAN